MESKSFEGRRGSEYRQQDYWSEDAVAGELSSTAQRQWSLRTPTASDNASMATSESHTQWSAAIHPVACQALHTLSPRPFLSTNSPAMPSGWDPWKSTTDFIPPSRSEHGSRIARNLDIGLVNFAPGSHVWHVLHPLHSKPVTTASHKVFFF